MSKKNKLARRPRGGNGMRGMLDNVSSSIRVPLRFKFVTTNSVDRDINVAHIRNLIGIGYHTALPANGIYRLIDMFRLKKVALMAVDPTSVTPVNLQLDWTAGTYQESNRLSSTSLGFHPAKIVAKPPKNTTSSFWVGSTDLAMFHLICPNHTFVEIWIEAVLVDNNGTFNSTINTVVDANFYVKPLDTTLGSTQGVIEPQGFPNVILI